MGNFNWFEEDPSPSAVTTVDSAVDHIVRSAALIKSATASGIYDSDSVVTSLNTLMGDIQKVVSLLSAQGDPQPTPGEEQPGGDEQPEEVGEADLDFRQRTIRAFQSSEYRLQLGKHLANLLGLQLRTPVGGTSTSPQFTLGTSKLALYKIGAYLCSTGKEEVLFGGVEDLIGNNQHRILNIPPPPQPKVESAEGMKREGNALDSNIVVDVERRLVRDTGLIVRVDPNYRSGTRYNFNSPTGLFLGSTTIAPSRTMGKVELGGEGDGCATVQAFRNVLDKINRTLPKIEKKVSEVGFNADRELDRYLRKFPNQGRGPGDIEKMIKNLYSLGLTRKQCDDVVDVFRKKR